MSQERDENGRYMPKNAPDTYLHDQVNRLDREVVALSASQDSLVKTVGELAGSVNVMSTDMREGFAKLAEERATSSKTNWQTITSIASVFLLIVGGLYGLVASSAADGRAANAVAINDVKQILTQHTQGGHPESVLEKVSALEKSHDKEIDRINQKAERALLDLQSRSGKRFNREDHDKYVVPRFETLEEFVATNREVDATQDARLDFLEKDVIKDIENRIGDRFTMKDYEREVKPELSKLIEEKNALQAEVQGLKVLVERISQEQLRRTEKVYTGK